MDTTKSGYDEGKANQYVLDQAQLWCDDLCVKTIKSKDKELMVRDREGGGKEGRGREGEKARYQAGMQAGRGRGRGRGR